MRRTALLLLVAGVAGACAATPKPAAPKPETKVHPGMTQARRPLPPALEKDPRTLEYAPLEHTPPAPDVRTWDSGLTVYLLEDHELPLVDAAVIVGAGRRDAPADRPGAVELLERTWRRGGAGERDADTFEATAEGRAIELDVSTGADRTDVRLSTLSRHLPLALELLCDLLARPRFQADRLEVERGRAIEAVRRRNDRPQSIAGRELRTALYGAGSPWARLPTQAELTAVTRDDLLALHRRLVTPGNARLVLVGDFATDAALATLKDRCGGWTGPAPERPAVPAEGRPTGPARRLAKKPDARQAVLVLGQRLVPRHHPDRYALDLLNHLLGGSIFDSRLGQLIRSDRGLAYAVRSGLRDLLHDVGYLYVFAGTRPDKAGETLSLAERVVREMHAEARIGSEELARAKDAFVHRHVFNYATPYAVAVQQAVLDYYGYPPDYLAKYPERIAAITADDIASAARTHLTPDRLVTVLGAPEAPQAEGWTEIDLERAVR